jgi:hypothetical protein
VKNASIILEADFNIPGGSRYFRNRVDAIWRPFSIRLGSHSATGRLRLRVTECANLLPPGFLADHLKSGGGQARVSIAKPRRVIS